MKTSEVSRINNGLSAYGPLRSTTTRIAMGPRVLLKHKSDQFPHDRVLTIPLGSPPELKENEQITAGAQLQHTTYIAFPCWPLPSNNRLRHFLRRKHRAGGQTIYSETDIISTLPWENPALGKNLCEENKKPIPRNKTPAVAPRAAYKTKTKKKT